MVNERLGKFELLSLLGSGQSGCVYRARNSETRRLVALKLFDKKHFSDGKAKSRFEREVLTLRALQHPRIVSLLDSGFENGQAWMEMQLVDGESLRAVNDRGSLSVLAQLRGLLFVGQALDHAHAAGFVHRDVKPENILVSTTQAMFLTDFGIAKSLNETNHLTSTGVAIGTPAYMSPEQALDSDLTAKSDLYSLGVVLYEVLYGQLPFVASTGFALLHKHVHSDLQFMPLEISRSITDLLRVALAKTPSERSIGAQELTRGIYSAALKQHPSAWGIAQPNRERVLWQTMAKETRELLMGPEVLIISADATIGRWLERWAKKQRVVPRVRIDINDTPTAADASNYAAVVIDTDSYFKRGSIETIRLKVGAYRNNLGRIPLMLLATTATIREMLSLAVEGDQLSIVMDRSERELTVTFARLGLMNHT